MIPILKILLAGAVFCTAAVAAPPRQVPDKLMARLYGPYDRELECWYRDQRCTELLTSRTVQIGSATYTFVAMAGNLLGDASHNETGSFGFFVFQGKPSAATLVAKVPDIGSGTWGRVGDLRFAQFGPRLYGWRIQNGFSFRGFSSEQESFWYFDGKHFVQAGDLNTFQSDEGAMEKVTAYEAHLRFMTDRREKGLFPLEVKVERTVQGKKAAPLTFVIHPAGGKYPQPKDYPIEGY